MLLKFNCAACLAITIGAISAPMALWSPIARAEQLPLIVPEATFSALGRITGDTLNQRLMDHHSTVSLWRPAVTTHGRKLDNLIDVTRNDSTSVFDDNPAITRTQTPCHRVGTASVVAAYPDVAILRVQKSPSRRNPVIWSGLAQQSTPHDPISVISRLAGTA